MACLRPKDPITVECYLINYLAAPPGPQWARLVGGNRIDCLGSLISTSAIHQYCAQVNMANSLSCTLLPGATRRGAQFSLWLSIKIVANSSVTQTARLGFAGMPPKMGRVSMHSQHAACGISISICIKCRSHECAYVIAAWQDVSPPTPLPLTRTPPHFHSLFGL